METEARCTAVVNYGLPDRNGEPSEGWRCINEAGHGGPHSAPMRWVDPLRDINRVVGHVSWGPLDA